MSIVRFSPFEQMDSLRRQIDRVFAEIDRVNPGGKIIYGSGNLTSFDSQAFGRSRIS